MSIHCKSKIHNVWCYEYHLELMYCTFDLGVYSIIVNHIEYSILDMVEKWFVLISLHYS
jgi:hypothetical protein